MTSTLSRSASASISRGLTVSVSYTHLDVYKRQAEHRPAVADGVGGLALFRDGQAFPYRVNALLRRCLLYTSDPMALQFQKHPVIVQLFQVIGEPLVPDRQQAEEAGPVSYTHLDVYKRQISKYPPNQETEALSHCICLVR